MTSRKLIISTMVSGFAISRPVLDVALDAGDDGVAGTVPAKATCIDVRSDVAMALSGSVTTNGTMAGIGAAMLEELDVVATVVHVICSEAFVTTAPCVADVRVGGARARTVSNIDATVVTLFGMAITLMPGALTDFVSGFGAGA